MKCAVNCCKAKINIFSTIECKCGKMFCDAHRLMMDHECDKLKEEKESHKRDLIKQNPVVKNEKIEKI